jgi:hypothetical protein
MSEPSNAPKALADQQAAKTENASPAPAAEANPVRKLTKEEQMAAFEEDLKYNDWGHQPC